MTGLTYGGLFEGYGGLTEAVRRVLGGDLAWYSEVEPAANRVLEHHHPDVPNLGDVTTVDWATTPRVNVLTGGFPCQDVSSAGLRSGLKEGTRSGLWSHMAKGIDILRPDLVVIENVRGILSAAAAGVLEPCPWCVGDDESVPLRALGCVLGDLADVGYDAQWCGLRASDMGAAHPRFRVVVAAWPASDSERLRLGAGRAAGPGEAPGGWARGHLAGCGDDAPPDSDGTGPQGRGLGGPVGPSAQRDDPSAPADPAGDGRREGRPEPARIVGGSDAALGGDASGWGVYEPAIRRWERVLGRPAPAPTVTGKRGGQQLSPLFVEWLMGLPAGHVTAVPGVTRNEALKLLGNGVVPQQIEAAVRFLLPAITSEVAA